MLSSLMCNSLLDLPAELWWIIVGFLPPSVRAILRSVCAGLRDFLDNPSLWRDAAGPAALRRACGQCVPAAKWVLAHIPEAPTLGFRARYDMLAAGCRKGALKVARWVDRAYPLRGIRPLAATRLLHKACEGRNPKLLRWLWHTLSRRTVWAPSAEGEERASIGAMIRPERFLWCGPLVGPAPLPPVPRTPGPDLLSRKLLASANLLSLRHVFRSAMKAGWEMTRCAVELFGEYLTTRDVVEALIEALRSGDCSHSSFLAETYRLSWELSPDDYPLLLTAGLAGGAGSAALAIRYLRVTPATVLSPPFAPWRASLGWLALGLLGVDPRAPAEDAPLWEETLAGLAGETRAALAALDPELAGVLRALL